MNIYIHEYPIVLPLYPEEARYIIDIVNKYSKKDLNETPKRDRKRRHPKNQNDNIEAPKRKR